MSTTPDGEYKWILHIVDHFSKFSSSFALRSKHAVEVAEKLVLWIGPQHILQCDDGTEFKDCTFITKKFEIRVLNGRQRHPQTQGLVEKHNSTLKRKLQAWIQDSGGTKLDNGFTELIDYAIAHHYPTLEFLSTTGRTTFVEDMIRKYEHVIQRTIQNHIETYDFWDLHRNDMLILDQKRRKRRGKGQANARVSFEVAKRVPIGYYY